MPEVTAKHYESLWVWSPCDKGFVISAAVDGTAIAVVGSADMARRIVTGHNATLDAH